MSRHYPFEHEDEAQFGDYVALLKPRVMSLVVFTAMVGLLVAPVPVHPFVAFTAILFIALGGGASGALNMWYDADIDAVMRRTRSRPVPSGRVSAGEALGLGLGLSGLSVMMLSLAGNVFAGLFLAFTIFFYAVVYTIWLKRRTPQNIVIGGAAGAFPPMIGWAVATGGIGLESLAMFALVFLWTPPHFWSLALFMKEDYSNAGVPMLTVTHGRLRPRGGTFWPIRWCWRRWRLPPPSPRSAGRFTWLSRWRSTRRSSRARCGSAPPRGAGRGRWLPRRKALFPVFAGLSLWPFHRIAGRSRTAFIQPRGLVMAITRDHELHTRRFGRNLGLGLVLGAFVVLVFGLTIAKVQRGDPMQAYDHQPRVDLLPPEPVK